MSTSFCVPRLPDRLPQNAPRPFIQQCFYPFGVSHLMIVYPHCCQTEISSRSVPSTCQVVNCDSIEQSEVCTGPIVVRTDPIT